MAWRRKQRGLSGCLALFALAVQLALSFGHIHTEDFASSAAAATLTAAPSDGAHSAPVPLRDTDHDDCPICSVMHLAGTLVLPPPPQISLPVPKRIFWVAAVERQIDAAAQRQPFQARAPPQA
ncbi:MAG: hypothetical protein WDN48_02085 [Pseudolabrys sp.]